MKLCRQNFFLVCFMVLIKSIAFFDAYASELVTHSLDVVGKNEKERNALYKKTRTQLKSAREQYKKHCTRLAELLAIANELDGGGEESNMTTRELKDFFDALGGAYTAVVDAITGRDELKKRINELEQINERLLQVIKVQNEELSNYFNRQQELVAELAQRQLIYEACMEKVRNLEQERAYWRGSLERLKVCSDAVHEGMKILEKEKSFVQEALNKLCDYVVASSAVGNR